MPPFGTTVVHAGHRDPVRPTPGFRIPGLFPQSRLSRRLEKHRSYPLYYYPLTRLEKLMVRTRFGGVGRCLVCGCWTHWRIHTENLRETGFCRACQSMNRYRALAYVVCRSLSVERGRNLRSLREVAGLDDLSVYNTDAHSAVHRTLASMKNYTSSEYLGPDQTGGAVVDGVMHQDLMRLSFPDGSFDLVLSADVFEHLPDPYRAHREVYRVLKYGGRHVFTVPFDQAQYVDDLRAVVEPDGTVRMLRPPVYHHDPIRPDEGCLVYAFFSLEMLVRLRRLGFRTHMYQVREPFHGIFGHNTLVFEAVKFDPPKALPSEAWFQASRGWTAV